MLKFIRLKAAHEVLSGEASQEEKLTGSKVSAERSSFFFSSSSRERRASFLFLSLKAKPIIGCSAKLSMRSDFSFQRLSSPERDAGETAES